MENFFRQLGSWLGRCLAHNPSLAGLVFSFSSFVWVKSLSEVQNFSASVWLTLALAYSVLAFLGKPEPRRQTPAPPVPQDSDALDPDAPDPAMPWSGAALGVLLVGLEAWLYSNAPLGMSLFASRGCAGFTMGAAAGLLAVLSSLPGSGLLFLEGLCGVVALWLMLPLPLPWHNTIVGDAGTQLAIWLVVVGVTIGNLFSSVMEEVGFAEGRNFLTQWRKLAPRRALLGVAAALVYGWVVPANWGLNAHDLALVVVAAVAHTGSNLLPQYPRRTVMGLYCSNVAAAGVLIQDAWTPGSWWSWWRFVGAVGFVFCAFLVAQSLQQELNRRQEVRRRVPPRRPAD